MKPEGNCEKPIQRIAHLENECRSLKAEIEISAKNMAEEKTKSEAILAAIGDPVVIIDRKYQVLYQNPIANNLFGDNLGKPCYQAYQGRTTVCAECALTASWRDGNIHKIDKVMTSAEGQKYVEIVASPLVNCQGSIYAGIEIVRDVTKRKLAEQGLLQANTLLKSILESTTDGILAVDQTGSLLGYNQNFIEIWNIPRHIIENYGDAIALKYVLEQLEQPEVFLRKVMRLYRSPNKIDLDVIPFKDGRIIERYSKPLMVDGKNIGRVWSFRDVTKKRRDEIEKKLLIAELQSALTEVKKLSGFLPICAHCKKIRDDQGYWKQIEMYIKEHSEAEFTHGICPDCARRHYPEFMK